MKFGLVCLIYSIADFAGMMLANYHTLFAIASFWAGLTLFYLLSIHRLWKRWRLFQMQQEQTYQQWQPSQRERRW